MDNVFQKSHREKSGFLTRLSLLEKNPMVRQMLRWGFLILSPLVIAGGLVYAFIFDPKTRPEQFIPCLINVTTGLYCPGCGITRSLHHFVHLDFLGALQYNFLSPFLFVILGYIYVSLYLRVLFKRSILWIPKNIPLWIIILITIFIVVFTVGRNLPWRPFSFFAP